jgi:superfamily II DNA or RNA helicase
MQIKYNAGLAQLKAPISPTVEEEIERVLSWRDRNIEYINVKNSWKGQYQPQDSRRYCYSRQDKTFPTGLLPYVLRTLETHKVDYTLHPEDSWVDNWVTPTKYPLPDWAWDHQVEIVKTVLDWRRCLIESPTASGKTSSIIFILQQFPTAKCLVAVPSVNLVNNLHKSLSQGLDEPIGRIGGGKETWERITVATGRSLSLYAATKYKEQMESINVLVFDECHNFGNKTGNSISVACKNTSYRVGVSATLTREDGSDIVLEGVIGPRALSISETVMVDLKVIHRPQLLFVKLPRIKVKIPVPKGELKPERHKVYEEGLVYNEYRNELIVSFAEHFLRRSGPRGVVLVLVERVEHGRILNKLFQDRKMEVPFIWGESGREREEAVAKFKSGELECLIASKILNEGEDVPMLELVINAAGGSGKRGIIQKTGRGLRKDASGRKRQAIIIDFYDNETHYLTSNSRSRIKNITERHPGTVEIISPEEAFGILQSQAGVVG